MTSCLLVKSSVRLVAVSDGRLSRDDDTKSFDTTRKIIKFPISYRIPIFAHGRIDHYQDYRSKPWFLAYAGTYTVTSEIINLFRQRIESLYLERHEVGQHAILVHKIDTSCYFDDSYNFEHTEYIKLEARHILQELRDAFEIKGSEYSKLRRERPDTQFLLFGNEEASGKYMAYTLSAGENGYTPGARLSIKTDPVEDGVLASIGSQAVANAVYDDRELMSSLADWGKDETIDILFESLPGWSSIKVAQRFCEIILLTTDPSVGGTMIVARGDWNKQINLELTNPDARCL